MRGIPFWKRLTLVVVAMVFSVGLACADTIVLKNGRRILVLSVADEGDKVRYQTAAGELTLPKSIVDHIERGGAVPSSAASLTMAPPAAESSLANAAAESAAVHDGAVDREFLAKAVAEATEVRGIYP